MCLDRSLGSLGSLAPFLLAGGLCAQVPNGHFVVSGFQNGGLFAVDPRTPGPAVPISGLGSELTGSGSPSRGANCVEIRQHDGTLFVGEVGASGDAIDLHVIALQGLAVRSEVKIPVGVVASGPLGGGIHQLALLPSGDVAVGVSGLVAQPPLNGSPIGIASLASGAVTPVVLAPPPAGSLNALAADRAGVWLYFASIASLNTTIYRVPLAGGTPQRLASAGGAAAALAVHDNGLVYFNTAQPSPAITSLDPVTGQTAVVAAAPASPNGLGVERASGDLVFVLNGFGPQGTAVYWMPLGGAPTQLALIPTGVPSGIAVKHTPWTFGVGSPAQNAYAWSTAPNPGGLPRLGNAAFALQLDATPSGNAAGAVVVAAAAANLRLGPVTLLLEPSAVLATGIVPASGTLPLPVPAYPGWVGVELFCQSFHVDAGGFAASDGLQLTVLR